MTETLTPEIVATRDDGMTTIAVFMPVELPAIEAAALSLKTMAAALTIENDEARRTVTADLRQIKARQKVIAAATKAIKAAFRDECNALTAKFDQPAAFLDEAEKALNRALDDHDRKLREAAKRAAEAAEREAAAQREELERAEREAAERAEAEAAELRRMAREMEQAEPEAARAIREAEAAAEAEREAAERHAQAERERIAAEQRARERAAAAISNPKIDGQYTRQIWKYEIVDLDAVPASFVRRELNAAKVRAHINMHSESGSIPPIAGLRFYDEDQRITTSA